MAPYFGPRDALEEFLNEPIPFLRDAFFGNEHGGTDYTNTVIGVIIGFYLLEVAFTIQFEAGSTYNLVSYFFKHYPWLVWPVAPMLHRGLGHFAVNIAFIYIAAPVEEFLSKARYLVLIIVAGFLPVYADGVKLAIYGDEPHVAAYGASAFGFGMLGYALAMRVRSDWELTPRWWIIIVSGISAIVVVLKNALIAIGDPVTLNLGHLLGLTVGFGFGYFWDS